MSKPKQLYWIGDRDAKGKPLEWFGAVPGTREAIPAMDLDAAMTANLTEAQWEAIESSAGQRLYQATDPRKSTSEATRAKAEAGDLTANKPESSSTGDATASPTTPTQPNATTASTAASSSP